LDRELVTVLVAGGGWFVAVLTVAIGYWERKSAREEERLSTTLAYFEGGSQKRSIGVALLEALWLPKKRHHHILVPVLSNQIVYMLLVTESKEAHQERNLIWMLSIFSEIPNLRDKFHERWADVGDAIYRKLQGEQGGVELSEATLKRWQSILGYAEEFEVDV